MHSNNHKLMGFELAEVWGLFFLSCQAVSVSITASQRFVFFNFFLFFGRRKTYKGRDLWLGSTDITEVFFFFFLNNLCKPFPALGLHRTRTLGHSSCPGRALRPRSPSLKHVSELAGVQKGEQQTLLSISPLKTADIRSEFSVKLSSLLQELTQQENLC